MAIPSVTASFSSGATSKTSLSPSARKNVDSYETYVTPRNPYLEEPAEEQMEEATPTKSPTGVWLDPQAVLVDCFGQDVGRDKLEQADLIGVCGWGVVMRWVWLCDYFFAALFLSWVVSSL